MAFQLELAAKNGFSLAEAQTLLNSIPRFFEDYDPKPSLLHGDLWSGNVSFDQYGRPFVYDPCCTTAIARLISLSPNFSAVLTWTSTRPTMPPTHWILDTNREKRCTIYITLNHFNLFGPPYDRQSASMASELLALAG